MITKDMQIKVIEISILKTFASIILEFTSTKSKFDF